VLGITPGNPSQLLKQKLKLSAAAAAEMMMRDATLSVACVINSSTRRPCCPVK